MASSILLCLGVAALVFATAPRRPNKTWVVNTADDGGTNCDTGQPCSLRDALFSAGSGDTIGFAIGTGHQTITIGTTLETSVTVTIDGTTQPGWATGKPVIEINCGGSSIDALHLLGTLSSSSSTAAAASV